MECRKNMMSHRPLIGAVTFRRRIFNSLNRPHVQSMYINNRGVRHFVGSKFVRNSFNYRLRSLRKPLLQTKDFYRNGQRSDLLPEKFYEFRDEVRLTIVNSFIIKHHKTYPIWIRICGVFQRKLIIPWQRLLPAYHIDCVLIRLSRGPVSHFR